MQLIAEFAGTEYLRDNLLNEYAKSCADRILEEKLMIDYTMRVKLAWIELTGKEWMRLIEVEQFVRFIGFYDVLFLFILLSRIFECFQSFIIAIQLLTSLTYLF